MPKFDSFKNKKSIVTDQMNDSNESFLRENSQMKDKLYIKTSFGLDRGRNREMSKAASRESSNSKKGS